MGLKYSPDQLVFVDESAFDREYHFEAMHGLWKVNELYGNVFYSRKKVLVKPWESIKDYTDMKTDIRFCLPCHSMAYYIQTS